LAIRCRLIRFHLLYKKPFIFRHGSAA